MIGGCCSKKCTSYICCMYHVTRLKSSGGHTVMAAVTTGRCLRLSSTAAAELKTYMTDGFIQGISETKPSRPVPALAAACVCVRAQDPGSSRIEVVETWL